MGAYGPIRMGAQKVRRLGFEPRTLGLKVLGAERWQRGKDVVERNDFDLAHRTSQEITPLLVGPYLAERDACEALDLKHGHDPARRANLPPALIRPPARRRVSAIRLRFAWIAAQQQLPVAAALLALVVAAKSGELLSGVLFALSAGQ